MYVRLYGVCSNILCVGINTHQKCFRILRFLLTNVSAFLVEFSPILFSSLFRKLRKCWKAMCTISFFSSLSSFFHSLLLLTEIAQIGNEDDRRENIFPIKCSVCIMKFTYGFVPLRLTNRTMTSSRFAGHTKKKCDTKAFSYRVFLVARLIVIIPVALNVQLMQRLRAQRWGQRKKMSERTNDRHRNGNCG